MKTSENDISKLEVIIPVKNRVEVLQCVRSLTKNLKKISRIIVCDGGSTDSKSIEVLAQLEQYSKVDVLRFPTPEFNKSLLINQGISQSKADFLLISDADILWKEATLERLLNAVASDSNTICYVQDVVESVPQSIALKRERYTYKYSLNNDVAFIEIVPWLEHTNQHRPGCGLILARRSTLLFLGGYKEIFTGWGWEDQDLLIRSSIFGIKICADGQVIHLSHEDNVRNLDYENLSPVATRNRNIIACLNSLSDGVLLGDLCIGRLIKFKSYTIQFSLPESLLMSFPAYS